MARRKKVAVIGGGASGLAAARAFSDKGHDVTAFARSLDLGGVWELSRSDPDVQTQSRGNLHCATGQPMPREASVRPEGPQGHACAFAHGDRHDPRGLVRLGSDIPPMDGEEGRGGWSLDVAAGGGQVIHSRDGTDSAMVEERAE